jgi:DNA-binding NarL/FixJ family response regulator
MVPPPSSIVSRAELQRLNLLRQAGHERLATPASGRPLLVTVIPTLRRIGAPAVRKMLAALRLRPRRRSCRLLRREAEVVALVAAGLRNAEIAERLYLSPKTVRHHVSVILAKLGVATRTEAARAAAQRGFIPS